MSGEEPLVKKRRQEAIAAQLAYSSLVQRHAHSDHIVLNAANESVRAQARYVLALLGSKGQPGELDD